MQHTLPPVKIPQQRDHSYPDTANSTQHAGRYGQQKAIAQDDHTTPTTHAGTTNSRTNLRDTIANHASLTSQTTIHINQPTGRKWT